MFLQTVVLLFAICAIYAEDTFDLNAYVNDLNSKLEANRKAYLKKTATDNTLAWMEVVKVRKTLQDPNEIAEVGIWQDILNKRHFARDVITALKIQQYKEETLLGTANPSDAFIGTYNVSMPRYTGKIFLHGDYTWSVEKAQFHGTWTGHNGTLRLMVKWNEFPTQILTPTPNGLVNSVMKMWK